MAKSISATMQFFYDDAIGSPVDITQHVITINDIDVENILEQTDPFGVAAEEHTPSGKYRVAPIEIGGLFETAAGGPDELFADRQGEGPTAVTRTFRIVWITGRESAVETHLGMYKRTPNRENGLTRYSVTLQPTGTITETIP
jgi:hypothetical protein